MLETFGNAKLPIILQRSEGVSVVKRRLLITMVGSTNVKIKGRAQCALL